MSGRMDSATPTRMSLSLKEKVEIIRMEEKGMKVRVIIFGRLFVSCFLCDPWCLDRF